MGNWFASLWNAANHWASNWFRGANGGPTTHTATGNSTAPAATGSGIAIHHGNGSGGSWRDLFRWFRSRRQRHRAVGFSVAPAAIAHGIARVRRGAVGNSVGPHAHGHGGAAHRRRHVAQGGGRVPRSTAAGTASHWPDDADLLLILAAEQW